MDTEHAKLILRIERGTVLTEQSIGSAYRQAALRCHPDKGGTVAEFAAVTEARGVLLKQIAKREKIKEERRTPPSWTRPKSGKIVDPNSPGVRRVRQLSEILFGKEGSEAVDKGTEALDAIDEFFTFLGGRGEKKE